MTKSLAMLSSIENKKVVNLDELFDEIKANLERSL